MADLNDIKKGEISEEELQVFKKVSQNALWYRGMPLGLMGMAIAHQRVKKLPTRSKAIGYFLGGISGYYLGILSYLPQARKQLMEQLPMDSLYRKKFEAIAYGQNSQEGAYPIQENASDLLSNRDQSGLTGNPSDLNLSGTQELADQSKYTSYEAMRQRNRSLQQPSAVPSTSSNNEVPSKLYASETVRYNKYGDPIVES